jgi:hypothetical protein
MDSAVLVAVEKNLGQLEKRCTNVPIVDTKHL